MIRLYGTLGPSCGNKETLRAMIQEGMIGARLNLSHGRLQERLPLVETLHEASVAEGIVPALILDTQGPEQRIGSLSNPLSLRRGEKVTLGQGEIPLSMALTERLFVGAELLLDDGKLRLRVLQTGDCAEAEVLEGGELLGGKSMAIVGRETDFPAVCAIDRENLRLGKSCGVNGVMQPFVRSGADIRELRLALQEAGLSDCRIFAKLETKGSLEKLAEIQQEAEEIVIARGDLGTAFPLWELPSVQQEIAKSCRRSGTDFMVVTQLLDSMQSHPVPTRAEVTDIFHAVLDGASSLLLTAETAVGRYPVEAMHYLRKTAESAERYQKAGKI